MIFLFKNTRRLSGSLHHTEKLHNFRRLAYINCMDYCVEYYTVMVLLFFESFLSFIVIVCKSVTTAFSGV